MLCYYISGHMQDSICVYTCEPGVQDCYAMHPFINLSLVVFLHSILQHCAFPFLFPYLSFPFIIQLINIFNFFFSNSTKGFLSSLHCSCVFFAERYQFRFFMNDTNTDNWWCKKSDIYRDRDICFAWLCLDLLVVVFVTFQTCIVLWTKYATSTLITWLNGVSPCSSLH